MINLPFSELGLSPELQSAIDEMGFHVSTPIQSEAIPVIRTGVDVIARSQTGSGKTVAFGIPAIECVDRSAPDVQVLILSPTRELCQQAGDELRKLSKHIPGIRTVDVYGGASMERQFVGLRRANIVVGTPGRIMDHMRRKTLKLDHLKMIILDEADEMLNMGFKEDVETILQDVSATRQIVLFSATMPPAIMALAHQFQNDPHLVEMSQNQTDLDISQTYVDVPAGRKQDALLLLLRYHRPTRAIIFSNTKTMVDELVQLLDEHGFPSEGLHGDMKQSQRTSVMNGFKKGKLSVLVATDVAARGIDVNDIDYVINFDLPKVAEYYVHRIGRTGRAGKSGKAISLCCGKRQIFQLQTLAKRTKASLVREELPTASDIERNDRDHNLNIVETALAGEIAGNYHDMVKKLMDNGHTAEEIAAAALQMQFKQDVPAIAHIHVSPRRNAEPERGGDRAPQKRSRERTRTGGVGGELLIDIGASSRVAPNHIVGALTERSGLSGSEIGAIHIAQDHTIVEIPPDRLDEVVQAMIGCKICGKPAHTEPLAETAGSPRRPARKPSINKYRGKSSQGFRKDSGKKSFYN